MDNSPSPVFPYVVLGFLASILLAMGPVLDGADLTNTVTVPAFTAAWTRLIAGW